MQKTKAMKRLLPIARGEKPAQLLFKNGEILDVFNGVLHRQKVALSDGIIVGIGDNYRAKKEIDLEGRILAPGFFDSHLHLESSMVGVGEFARRVIPQGTTTIFPDPHEIANVAGTAGIEYLRRAALKYPWNLNLMLPSCVPASPFSTPGAKIGAEELSSMIGKEGVFGLGEMMNSSGVINGDPDIWDKISMAHNLYIDGHAPGLSGPELNAYLLAGIKSDHETTTVNEVQEKLERGMYIMLREGSAARNLDTLLPAVKSSNRERFMLATDDLQANDLISRGHINHLLKKVVEAGHDPLDAIKMATINPARAFGLEGTGAIAPGYRADLAVINNFSSWSIHAVYKDGVLVAKRGKSLFSNQDPKPPAAVIDSVKMAKLTMEDFLLPQGRRFRVIRLLPDEIITRGEVEELEVVDGRAISENDDLNSLAVVERHQASGRVGLGLLRGMGLKRGAIASSVAHDDHHLIVAGTNPQDMLQAVRKIEEMQGGLAVSCEGKVLASLALPLGGLMSDQSMEKTAENLIRLTKKTKELGCKHDSPFMALSFLALPVIPELKLTDRGLFDSLNFKKVPLIVD